MGSIFSIDVSYSNFFPFKISSQKLSSSSNDSNNNTAIFIQNYVMCFRLYVIKTIFNRRYFCTYT